VVGELSVAGLGSQEKRKRGRGRKEWWYRRDERQDLGGKCLGVRVRIGCNWNWLGEEGKGTTSMKLGKGK